MSLVTFVDNSNKRARVTRPGINIFKEGEEVMADDIDKEDEKWIDNNLEEVYEDDLQGEFKGTVFLSTDGKQTVSVEASTKLGRKKGLIWAKSVYDRLLYTYGTKQKHAVKEYREAEHGEGYCSLHGIQMRQYSKNDKTWYSHKTENGEWCNGGKRRE